MGCPDLSLPMVPEQALLSPSSPVTAWGGPVRILPKLNPLRSQGCNDEQKLPGRENELPGTVLGDIAAVLKAARNQHGLFGVTTGDC